MLEHLAAACRTARTDADAGQTLVAALLGLNQSSVARFEAGDGWPRDPNRYVAAYAVAGHVTPASIWKAAVDAFVKDDAATDLPPELVAVEQALTAAVRSQGRARAGRKSSAATPARRTA